MKTWKSQGQLETETKERIKELETALNKMCEWHEKQATWDKGDNGYYEAKRLLRKE